jgi:transcription antitermination factor NusG
MQREHAVVESDTVGYFGATGTNHYVLIVDPNREHRAVEQLEARGFIAYTPRLWRRQRGPRNSVRDVRRAMFPCYAFVDLEAGHEDWRAVEAVPGVWRFMTIEHRPASLPQAALEAIRAKEAALEAAHKARTGPKPAYDFAIGQPVLALVGPYADIMAKVERFDDHGRVVLLMQMLGAAHEVTVERAELVAA